MDIVYGLLIVWGWICVAGGSVMWLSGPSDPESTAVVFVDADAAPDSEPTIRSLRPAELARASERTVRWLDSLPEEVAAEVPSDTDTVVLDASSLRSADIA